MDFPDRFVQRFSLDFRRQKLGLALGILVVGMLVALAWHGWQGWVLGKSYPYNTFLFLPSARFSDFTTVITFAESANPYTNDTAGYFPTAYLLFRCFAWMGAELQTYVYLSATSLGIWAALILAFGPLLAKPKPFLASRLLLYTVALILALTSYPLLIGLDRGNIEPLLALLVGLALFFFSKGFYLTGLLFLFPPVCLKFYPILFLVLFIRPRHVWKAIGFTVAFMGTTVWSLSTFGNSIIANWLLMSKNIAYVRDVYVLHRWGASGSASPWNALKAIVGLSAYCNPHFPPGKIVAYNPDALAVYYRWYANLEMAGIAGVLGYVVLIEREFFRRAILILCLITLIVPFGSDYRLIYANIALLLLILLPTRRWGDLIATALLAFVAVPKKEVLLPFLGRTDSMCRDISLGVILNPVCILAVMVLSIRDGLLPGWWHHLQQRFAGTANYFIRLVLPASFLFPRNHAAKEFP